jgi:hypothetical protein
VFKDLGLCSKTWGCVQRLGAVFKDLGLSGRKIRTYLPRE